MSDKWELIAKYVIAGVVLCVTFVIPVIVQNYFFQKQQEHPNATVFPTLFPTRDFIRIESIPPEKVPRESEFSYQVVVKYTGKESVSYEIINKPVWLSWDANLHRFMGIIPNGTVSFNIKFVVRAGTISETQDASVTVITEEMANPATESVAVPKSPETRTVEVTITTTPTPSASVSSGLPTISPRTAFVIDNEDPFHPIREDTSTVAVATVTATAADEADVLGAKTDIPQENSALPIIGVAITIIFIVITGIVILYPSRRASKEIFKTHTGLVVHSEHEESS